MKEQNLADDYFTPLEKYRRRIDSFKPYFLRP
jgi:hypothetical protein